MEIKVKAECRLKQDYGVLFVFIQGGVKGTVDTWTLTT